MDCGAYLARQTNEYEFKREMADYCLLAGISLDVEDYGCDGCKSDQNLFKCCRDCGVRVCATARHIDQCSLCENHPCSLLRHLFFV